MWLDTTTRVGAAGVNRPGFVDGRFSRPGLRLGKGNIRPRSTMTAPRPPVVTFTAVNIRDAVVEDVRIRAFIDGWNDRCHPFVWAKTAEDILKEGQPSANFRNAPLVRRRSSTPCIHTSGSPDQPRHRVERPPVSPDRYPATFRKNSRVTDRERAHLTCAEASRSRSGRRLCTRRKSRRSCQSSGSDTGGSASASSRVLSTVRSRPRLMIDALPEAAAVHRRSPLEPPQPGTPETRSATPPARCGHPIIGARRSAAPSETPDALP